MVVTRSLARSAAVVVGLVLVLSGRTAQAQDHNAVGSQDAASYGGASAGQADDGYGWGCKDPLGDPRITADFDKFKDDAAAGRLPVPRFIGTGRGDDDWVYFEAIIVDDEVLRSGWWATDMPDSQRNTGMGFASEAVQYDHHWVIFIAWREDKKKHDARTPNADDGVPYPKSP